MAQSGKTIRGIQGLRALAASAVVCAHLDLIQHGGFGVDIFFVISGFIIGYVGQTERAGIFAAKRIARVVPLYWIGTFVAFAGAAFAPALFKSTTAAMPDLLKSLFFIPFQNNAGFIRPLLFLGWSLNYEMFFYFLFWLGIVITPRRPEIFTTLVISCLIALRLIFAPTELYFDFYTYPMMGEFLLGLWLHRIWQAGKLDIDASKPVLMIGMVLIVSGMAAADYLDLFTWRLLTMGPLAMLLLAFVLMAERRFIWPSALLLVGDASYSLYLFHPYVVALAQKIVEHASHSDIVLAVATPIIFLLAIGFAILTYLAIERPLHRWMVKRLFVRPSQVAQGSLVMPTPAREI